MAEYSISRDMLIGLLDSAVDSTLGEIDKKGVFERTKNNPKITGIAGDVIEQSLLGMPGDNKQVPDLKVGDKLIELKTTGIRYSKKVKGKFEAKEPMSITAVSPEQIVNESFYDSNFWHKVEYMLLVFYHYDSSITVKAEDYSNFYVKGYTFNEFSDVDEMRLKSDWEIIREFIHEVQSNFNVPENEYPRLSSELRSKLLYLDTAPKWPNRPRFRFKRKFVSGIVEEYFEKNLEHLPLKLNALDDLRNKCKLLTQNHRNMKIEDLKRDYGLEKEKTNKSIGERIIIKMLGGESKKINQIEFFRKADISAKTITVTRSGGRTEDMKLLPVDFDEIMDQSISFEESKLYDYFRNKKLLCIVFEEESKKSSLDTNRFIGFKEVYFNDDFINDVIKTVWRRMRRLVNENELEEAVVRRKDGTVIINKNGTVRKTLNFPKSQESIVFVRGSGTDSSKKPHEINGIKMYRQNYWIKGSFIAEKLEELPFL